MRRPSGEGGELPGEEGVDVRALAWVLGDEHLARRLRGGHDRVCVPVAPEVGELLEAMVDGVQRIVLGDVRHGVGPGALEGLELILGEGDLVRLLVPLHDHGGRSRRRLLRTSGLTSCRNQAERQSDGDRDRAHGVRDRRLPAMTRRYS